MPKPLASTDFRAVRIVLEPDDFAIGPDEPDAPPADLIDESTWDGIMTLPTDVSIWTSNDQGSLLTLLHDLEGAWIEAVSEEVDTPDPMDTTMLDACDEFGASTFLALHGYYRPAIGCLRNALELVTIGVYCQVCDKATRFDDWTNGRTEIRFGEACDGLASAPALRSLKRHLRSSLGDSLFDQKQQTTQGGWARRLYKDLSDYAHSRPQFTNGALWESNGPVYNPDVMQLTATLCFEIYALAYVMVKIARPEFQLPDSARKLFGSPEIVPTKIAYSAYRFTFLGVA